MSKLTSLILAAAKWPVGIVALLLTPSAAVSCWHLLLEAWDRDAWLSPFGLGVVAGAVAWMILRQSRFVSFWSTLEHEFTHALFAWLTFVPVLELRSTDGSGAARGGGSLGHVRLGGSNWLITISPYFFPTAAVVLLVATWLLAAQPTVLARALLGVTIAYSLGSTWQETHVHQSDLKECGFVFAWLFLPGANLICYGSLLAFEIGGLGRMADFVLAAGGGAVRMFLG